MSGFTGVTEPRRYETVESRIVRVLTEFRRPVPLPVLARMTQEPETAVSQAVDALATAGKVKRDGNGVRLSE